VYLPHPITHVCLQRPIRHIFKSVRTRVLTRQGGAHPRLHVTHLKPKRHTSSSGGSQLAHLLQQATDLFHDVIEVGEAVVENGGGTMVGFKSIDINKA
jgi:hypothetical protein